MNASASIISQNKPKVLVADDNRDMLVVLRGWLEEAGMEVVTASNGRAALKRFDDSFSAVLLDLHMPGLDGIETLKEIRKRNPDIQCIMVTGEKGAKKAVEAMKAGAFDYVTKPPNSDELRLLLEQAIHSSQLARENANLKGAFESKTTNDWIGNSPASADLLKKAKQVAKSDSPVLITGETGTGKSLLSRTIHEMSVRGGKPFITVSCAAIPRELMESELFGHKKGSFTGATRDRPGRMQIVEDGTLFMDEIGEVPLIVQPKILRVLQEREFEAVGSDKTLHMGARIIAATNRDLEKMCLTNDFREDLFFRLNVLHLHIPPIRERPEDLRPLVDQTMQRLCATLEMSRKLADSAWELIHEYEWPGNVRELQNVLDRAITFAESNTITRDDLGLAAVAASDSAHSSHRLAGLTLDEIEKIAIEETLIVCGGNKAEAARQLGVSEKTIYNKIKKLGVETP